MDAIDITANNLESMIIRSENQLRLKKKLSVMIQVATVAHFGQTDRGGHPYILHCLHVGMEQPSLMGKIIGIGHDLFEDTAMQAPQLSEYGFCKNPIIDGITTLTRQYDETPEEAAMRLKQSPMRDLLIPIKLSDLRHNQRLDRLAFHDERDLKRNERYKRIEDFLLDPTAFYLAPFQ